MVENPSRVSRHNPTANAEASKTRSSSERKNCHPVIDDDDGGGEAMKCSRAHYSSCTANLVADCIAVCCCPCAIVNMLILAFVKVPWMMGRRCLRFVKKKGQMLEQNKGGRNRIKSTSS
ncbi:hypothetical protein BVC80_8965g6 [Macleaya cordata]|uniref:Transmembrane protein n=1 Tax=Macleaya cordata TaxID=56857 RepID=A0A200QAU7_MACCD|nr:hypothetical protein BVC80_8965g6 [Macleaya cordata]